MRRYTPIFSSLVDSSVWTLPDSVRVVWVTMLALQDRDHVVRYNAFGIAQRAHKSEREVLDALNVLASPDKTRLEPQEYDGRRVERHEDGWLILNGSKYQAMMIEANRREYQRQWMQGHRDRVKESGAKLPKSSGGSMAERVAVKAAQAEPVAKVERGGTKVEEAQKPPAEVPKPPPAAPVRPQAAAPGPVVVDGKTDPSMYDGWK